MTDMLVSYVTRTNVKAKCSYCGHTLEYGDITTDEGGPSDDIKENLDKWFTMYGWDVDRCLCPDCNKREHGTYYTVEERWYGEDGSYKGGPIQSSEIHWTTESAEKAIENRRRHFSRKSYRNDGTVRKWIVWKHTMEDAEKVKDDDRMKMSEAIRIMKDSIGGAAKLYDYMDTQSILSREEE